MGLKMKTKMNRKWLKNDNCERPYLLPAHARIPTVLPVEPVEPLPPPAETPTLVGGYGFVRIGVQVALGLPVTIPIHFCSLW